MKFMELEAILSPDGLFRTGEILAGRSNPAGVRRQLDRWVKRGHLLQLRRGIYQLRRRPGENAPHPFKVSGCLKKNSYVSLQSALSHHGMIPEYVPATTSITTGRPETRVTPVGRFIFRHVKPARFFGFEEAELGGGQTALLATPAKALVDLLLLTPGSDSVAYLRELRLEPSRMPDAAELQETARKTGSLKTLRAASHLCAPGFFDEHPSHRA